MRAVIEIKLKPESSYSIIQVPSGWCGRAVHRSITASQGEVYSCGGAEEAQAQNAVRPLTVSASLFQNACWCLHDSGFM